jgi:xanthosine utilization system XapX-like protein
MDDNTSKVLLALIGLIGIYLGYRQRQQGQMLQQNTTLTQKTATTQAESLPRMAAKLDTIQGTVEAHDEKLEAVHNEMNSMKDALIKDAGIVGHAQGMADEKQAVADAANAEKKP